MLNYQIVQKQSYLGYLYWVGEIIPKDMRIADEYLDCVFYLYKNKEQAEKGEKAGGTGFFVEVKSETHSEVKYLYAITNKHVIVNPLSTDEQRAPVIRINTKLGKTEIFDLTKANWLLSEIQDLAITLIGLNDQIHKTSEIPLDMFLTQNHPFYNEVGTGSDLFFIGRYTFHHGKEQNFPAVRFGTIAVMPDENNKIYYKDLGTSYANYLAEARSIRGFSGSPAFMYIPPLTPLSGKSLNRAFTTLGPFFLGVVSSSFPQPEKVLDQNGNDTGCRTNYNSGIMMVIPAWNVLDLINSEILMKQRKENDKKISEKKQEQGPQLDYAEIEKEVTKENFTETLKKVSQKIKPSQPDSSKPKT